MKVLKVPPRKLVQTFFHVDPTGCVAKVWSPEQLVRAGLSSMSRAQSLKW